MNGHSPVVFIGFDAMDAGLARHLAAEGRMPTLARLLEEGAAGTVANPPGLLVGGTWPSFWTGWSPARHGFYCYQQVEKHGYRVQELKPQDIEGKPFWETLDGAGKRTCIIDVPLVPLSRLEHGLHIIDWGTHDRLLTPAAWPQDLHEEVTAPDARYPLIGKCDDYAIRKDWDNLYETLIAGLEKKTDLNIRLMKDGPWDVFTSVYAESHCAGHQFWWGHDPNHADYTPDAGDPMVRVYEALDRTLARLLEQVPEDANFMLLLSHGIGSHNDADHLLQPILLAFDEALGRASAAVVWRERLLRRVQWWAARLRSPELAREGRLPRWIDGSRRFTRIPNNELYGGIRINLEGREPRGVVKRTELAATIAWLEDEFLKLREPGTDRPIVRRVMQSSDLYAPGENSDVLPDLLIDWDRRAPITGVESETIGVIRGEPGAWRSGDHRPMGLIVGRGPNVQPGVIRPGANNTDLGATIAALAGVNLPDTDGVPIARLTGGHE